MRIEDALSATVEWKVAVMDAQHLDELGYLSSGEMAKKERVQAVKHAITKALKFTDEPQVEQALTDVLHLIDKQ